MISMTERQRGIIVSGLTSICGLALVLTVFLAGYVVVKAVNFAAPALMPMLLGLFLALLFKPIYERIRRGVVFLFRKTLGLRARTLESAGLDTFAALAVFCGLILLLPVWMLCSFDFKWLLSAIAGLIDGIPAVLGKLVASLNANYPAVQETLARLVDGQNGGGFDLVGLVQKYGMNGVNAVGGVIHYVMGFQSILLVAAFFLLFLAHKPRARGEDLTGRGVRMVSDNLPFLKAETRTFILDLVQKFMKILVGYFRVQVAIDIGEGLVFGTVLHFVMPYGFVLGFLFGFLNLIPVIGTLVCLPLVLPFAYFGEGGSLARLLLVGGLILVFMLVDQIVTTKVQKDNVDLSTVTVVFSYVFWGLVFHSFVGMLLAIPLTAFCKVAWEGIKSKLPKDMI